MPALASGALVLGACTSAPNAAPTFPTAPTAPTITPSGCEGFRSGAQAAAGGLPDVSLPCLGSGPDVDLARLRGPAVVNVWASWCGPCVEELPVMARFAAGTSTVRVLGVDYEDLGRADAVASLSQAGVRYPSVVDSHGHVGPAGVPPLPSTFLVDSAGKVVHHQVVPYSSVSVLQADVRRYLGVSAG